VHRNCGYIGISEALLLSHGENRGSSPLGSPNDFNNLLGRDLISVPKVSPGTGASRFNWIKHPRRICRGAGPRGFAAEPKGFASPRPASASCRMRPYALHLLVAVQSKPVVSMTATDAIQSVL
jgi:hypothetical protein